MCRWLAYSGSPLALEQLLYAPEHSLIVQSLHSQLGRGGDERRRVRRRLVRRAGDPGGLPQHRAGVERPEPARAVRPRHVGARVRAHPCLDRLTGAADELPSVPPWPLAVDAQRLHRRVRPGEARPRARGRSRRSSPGSRERPTRRCSSTSLSPMGWTDDPPAAVARAVGFIEDDRPPARRREPHPDDRRDDGRRERLGVSLCE